jgi:hypothetical protein
VISPTRSSPGAAGARVHARAGSTPNRMRRHSHRGVLALAVHPDFARYSRSPRSIAMRWVMMSPSITALACSSTRSDARDGALHLAADHALLGVQVASPRRKPGATRIWLPARMVPFTCPRTFTTPSASRSPVTDEVVGHDRQRHLVTGSPARALHSAFLVSGKDRHQPSCFTSVSGSMAAPLSRISK